MIEAVHIVGVVVIYLVYNLVKWSTNSLRKIPGPNPLPLIGNLHQMDAKKPHVQFTKWKEEYGDIFCIKIVNDYTVVLNSVESIREALITKGPDFAGRPPMFRANYSVYDGGDIGFQTYTPKLQHMRKVGHWALKSYGVGMARLENVMIEEIRDMLGVMSEFKGQPFDPQPVLHAATCNIMTTIIIGKQFKTTDEEVKQVMLFDKLLGTGLHPVDGAILDVFPWLRFFGNETFKILKKGIEARDDFIDKQFLRIKETINPDNVRGVFDALFLNQGDAKNNNNEATSFGPTGSLDDRDIKGIINDLVIAGTLTTSTALNMAILVLLNNPDVKKKLHQEIDNVVPRDRLPVLEDRQSMTYMDAFIYELLRYMSHVPLSLPHYTMADTSVGGYMIPKGTQVLTNTWAVAHDDRYYTEPWQFRPERFLDDEERLVQPDHPARRYLMSFGAGRRICIGENLAKSRLFLILAAILHRFDVVPEDPSNVPLSDPREFSVGLVILPDAFKFRALERH